jgi:hypothetical protein
MRFLCLLCYLTLPFNCITLSGRRGTHTERKAKEQLAENYIITSWEKEMEGDETYCQRQEKMKELVDNLCS